jgi:hypothetical protein
MIQMDEILLSEKEQALYDKIVAEQPVLLSSLGPSEVGGIGKLKHLGVEIFKNRQKEDTPLRYMEKYVRIAPEPEAKRDPRLEDDEMQVGGGCHL